MHLHAIPHQPLVTKGTWQIGGSNPYLNKKRESYQSNFILELQDKIAHAPPSLKENNTLQAEHFVHQRRNVSMLVVGYQ